MHGRLTMFTLPNPPANSDLIASVVGTALASTAGNNLVPASRGHDYFRGVASWPDIDCFFEAVGKALLACDFQTGLAAGVTLSPEGRLTFRDPSPAAHSILRSIAEAGTGFHSTDAEGVRWAMQINAHLPGRPGAWLAHGLSIDRDCRLFGPDYREAVLQRLKTRLDVLLRHRHCLSANGYRRRAKLTRQHRRISLIGQALDIMSWILTQIEHGTGGLDLKAKSAGLATVLWGVDSSLWPLHWQAELFASVAMLGRLQQIEIEFSKTGWGPRPTASETALQSVRQQGEDLILSFSPGFLQSLRLFGDIMPKQLIENNAPPTNQT